jgi:hypothetical protein
VLAELLLDLLHGFFGLGSNMQVIYIAGCNQLVTISIKDIHTRFRASLGKSNRLHDLTELEIPLSENLLKAIDRRQ